MVNVEPLEETPPTPQAETSKIEPPPEPLPEPVERQVETELPKLPQMERAEAVLPMPAPPPPEPQQEEKKPEEEKKKSEPKEAKSKPKPKSVAQVASAPKPNEAARAKVNAAPFSGTASAASVATWRGTVIAHLNRLKRSAGGNRGTATVAFSIDRSGRVISARLIRSSGNPGLDKEAVALVRRASPVPPPPANIKNNPVLLTAPVAVSR